MFNERFKNSVKQAKLYPGADINSDLSPVAVKIKIKLKKQMLSKGKEQVEIGLLREKEYKTKCNLEVQNTFDKWSLEGMEQHDEQNINIVEANGID